MRMFLVTVGALLLSGPVAAEKLSLSALSAYLNGLQSAEAKFTQINGDGTISTGDILIKRPGRIRFEYDPPEKTLVVAGGGAVAIFDPKAGPRPETYPLNKTPLSLILAKNVDLARAKMVVGHSYDGTATTITAQDPEHPEYGNIQLKFTDSPVELRQWIINDEGGNSTTVILGEMTKDVSLGDTLFNIEAATERQKR
ncbi:MAG: outer membrane lipoprotein carrier protein LolA [Rhodobacteraceae bacterium]|jgi:outer membrane lipoprotein-sorting protein|nr:outer membrane lipoprotein carrier protein LolA [Paracoccaceae bacterium]